MAAIVMSLASKPPPKGIIFRTLRRQRGAGDYDSVMTIWLSFPLAMTQAAVTRPGWREAASVGHITELSNGAEQQETVLLS